MAENEKWAAFDRRLAADRERYDEIAASCKDSLAYFREQLEKALKKHEEKQQKTAEEMDGEMSRAKAELKGLRFFDFGKKTSLKKKLRALRKQAELLRNPEKLSANRAQNETAIRDAAERYSKELEGYLAECFPSAKDPEPKRDGQEPPEKTNFHPAEGFIAMPRSDVKAIVETFV